MSSLRIIVGIGFTVCSWKLLTLRISFSLFRFFATSNIEMYGFLNIALIAFDCHVVFSAMPKILFTKLAFTIKQYL